MTENAIKRILSWNPHIKIHVSIDGIRSSADDHEKSWRMETILRVEKQAELNKNVIPYVWEVNKGLTAHAIRIFDRVFETTGSIVSLEEDNLVTEMGFEFLVNSTASDSTPGIASAYTSQTHQVSSNDSRFTLFPEQWATALNLPVYEEFKRTWHSKSIHRHVTEGMMSHHFKGDPLFRRIAVEKWHRIFIASVNDLSYGDALMTYAAFKLNTPYQVPMKSLVYDIGSLDPRGIHPRENQDQIPPHLFESFTVGNNQYCSTCERSSSGIAGRGFMHIGNFAVRKCKSLLGLKELQPQK